MNEFARCAVVVGFLCVLSLVGYAEKAQGGDAERIFVKQRKLEAKEEAPQGDEAVADVLAEKVDANVEQFEKQFLPQFRQLLKSELSFVKRVCHPSKAQRQAIAKASDRCLKVAARKYATAMNKMMHVWGRSRSNMPNARELISEGLLELIRKHCDAEQVKQYQEEVAKRSESLKRATVLGLAAQIDEKLVLDDEQRSKLIESLSENWQDEWSESLQMLVHGNEYMHDIPDKIVVPLLDKTQRTVWRGIEKQDHFFWGGGFGFVDGGAVLEDFEMEIVVREQEAAPVEEPAQANE